MLKNNKKITMINLNNGIISTDNKNTDNKNDNNVDNKNADNKNDNNVDNKNADNKNDNNVAIAEPSSASYPVFTSFESSSTKEEERGYSEGKGKGKGELTTKDSIDEIVRDESKNFFEVNIPDVLKGDDEILSSISDTDNNWIKVKGWYNELNFYSKVFQFFVEGIKERESLYGWLIIVISSITSFITMFTLDSFNLTQEETVHYTWGKNLFISVLSTITTLIAAWVKKKSFIKRIQVIDKRIARLEKFLGVLDYQFRLVPVNKRQNYLNFITKHKEEHNLLAIYSNLISPSEFTYTVYIITKYNAPLISGTWPWYDTATKKPKPNFALNIIKNYDTQYSCSAWCQKICCYSNNNYLECNPLININKK